MKKYLHILMLLTFAILTPALTSCGDDDDEPGGSNKGSLTIDGTKYSFNVMLPGSQADMYSCSMWNTGDADHLAQVSIYDWSTIETGTVLDEDTLTFTWHSGNEDIFIGLPTSGTVKVKKRTSSSITLTFTNVSFRDYRDYNGEGKLTVTGEITLPID